ncbi:MAG: OmpA family protein [Treponema sp.]|nr:OmpA family protein [Treponema sp.]
MKKISILRSLFLGLSILLPLSASAETYDTNGGAVEFTFKYQEGDSYRILSTVNEDVYVNMRLHHSAEIINRISTQVLSVNEDGSATHKSTFMTTESSQSAIDRGTFSWGEEYLSIFDRSKKGVYTIDDQYFMPTVRDVPIFPDHPIKPGDTWTAEGHEAHDLRLNFGIQTPYKVPFTATYTYLGTVNREKKQVRTMSYAAASVSKKTNNQSLNKGDNKLHVFRVKYSMYMETPERNFKAIEDPYADYPQAMMGFSDELVYWDAEKGAIDHYTETFRILIETAYGRMYEFRGTAHAEVSDFIRTDTPDNMKTVQTQIDELGLDDVNVVRGDKGLTISIENIQFKPDSAILVEGEKEKLQRIAEILSLFPENELLVSGHTAMANNGVDSQTLSENRAQTVADYFISLGVKDRHQIYTQGFGDSLPIAPNTTEEGRAKNRRVEITIMDK